MFGFDFIIVFEMGPQNTMSNTLSMDSFVLRKYEGVQFLLSLIQVQNLVETLLVDSG